MVGGMSRPLRLEFEGALYHATSRGNERRTIFRDDSDRARFLEFFGSVAQRERWVVHSYCLMGNHYHLLLETPLGNLSRLATGSDLYYVLWLGDEPAASP